MHINPNINILNFLKQVQKCNGEVLFETSEGDRIALKSTLSQYIFLHDKYLIRNCFKVAQSGLNRTKT